MRRHFNKGDNVLWTYLRGEPLKAVVVDTARITARQARKILKGNPNADVREGDQYVSLQDPASGDTRRVIGHLETIRLDPHPNS